MSDNIHNDINLVELTDTDGKVLDGLYIYGIESVNPSRLISAPVEDGTIRFDNKVIDPRGFSVKGLITTHKAYSTLDSLESMRQNKTMKFCTLTSKFDVIDNLAVEKFITSDKNNMFDAIEVVITLKQIIIAKSLSSDKSTYCGTKNFIPAK